MPKNRLRQVVKKKLISQSEEERLRKSQKIARRLFALKKFKRAKVIMFYVAKDSEVETRRMIAKAQALGKRIVVPHISRRSKKMLTCELKNMEDELDHGPYGIHQPKEEYKRPVAVKSIDLAIVPGVAFTKDGHRLGRGGGYFDRFLSRLSKKVLKVGLAFDFQIVDALPSLSHDIPVDLVLSA